MALLRRALLVVLTLRFLPFPFGAIFGTRWLGDAYREAWTHASRALGYFVLGRSVPATVTGSTDRLVDYLELALQACVAMGCAGAWPWLARRIKEPVRVRPIIERYLQCALAAKMVMYGAAKIWPIQFPEPSWFTLTQTYGESSPMGLLWTFMGYSRPYAVFIGCSELLAGALLLWGRTVVLGALLVLCIMTNVVMMNLCYDVPVKLGSMTFLATSVAMLVASRTRLAAALTLLLASGAAAPARRYTRLAGGLLIAAVAVVAGLSELNGEVAHRAQSAPLAGFYEVESFEGPAGQQPWRQVEVTPQVISVRNEDGSGQRYVIDSFVEREGRLSLLSVSKGRPPRREDLQVRRASTNQLEFRGQLNGYAFRVLLRAIARPTFPLMEKRVHWISEAAYRR